MLPTTSLAAGAGLTTHVTGGDYTIVVVIALVGLAALGVAGFLVREVLAASTGNDEDAGDRQGGAGGGLGLPRPPVPHPRRLRGHRLLRPAAAAGRHHQRALGPVAVLPGRRRRSRR